MKILPEYDESETNKELLFAQHIPDDLYARIHEYTVIPCHDVFIKTAIKGKEGILLVNRVREPAKDEMWPIGGRVLRGLTAEDSLRKKVMEECGLTLRDIEYLGTARTTFKSDIYGHGRGTDTLNLIYWARGEGELKLDPFHKSPLIVTREEYLVAPEAFEPYIQHGFDLISESNLW